MKFYQKETDSPVGRLTLVASDAALVAVLWEKEKPGRVDLPDTEQSDSHPLLLAVETQLAEYFTGERREFDLPLEFRGTGFQQRVWKGLQKIPFGKTRSYGELATELGSPDASRAVGAATGRNPLSIVVPCHRLVGGTGKLTGFAGGIEAKEKLLRLEGWEG